VVGSAPGAIAAAVRRPLGGVAESPARDVAATVLGRPPGRLVVPRASATVGGLALDRLFPAAVRSALGRVEGRWPGPVALAAAATRVLRALFASDPSLLPALAVPPGRERTPRAALAVAGGAGPGPDLSARQAVRAS